MLPTGRKNPQLIGLRQQFHTSLGRYDVAYKQSTKSFLTETIGAKDTARDKVTKVIEWVARYWVKLPDDEGDVTPVEPEATAEA